MRSEGLDDEAYKGSMSVGQLKQRAERLQGKLDKLEEK
eukprot:COSAG05_NODE_951_length_6466_cov_130.129417_4_plen_38_part_00